MVVHRTQLEHILCNTFFVTSLVALQAVSMHYEDVQAVHSVFGSACYIDDSFPVVLYLAAKYPGALCGCGVIWFISYQ